MNIGHKETAFRDNDYKTIIKLFTNLEDNAEVVKGLFLEHKDSYGLFMLGMLVEIAYQRNKSFWFEMISFIYQFEYHYII